MLMLNDGRAELWQWDTGRTLSVDADCSQVHFSNNVFGRSIDVDVVDGVAIIPDILLQTDKDLNVFAFVGTAENGYTKISKTFKVNRRNKPADYVFTPVEQTTIAEIAAIAQSVRDDADSGAFDGQDAEINGYNTVNIVAGENIKIEQSDNTLTISSTGGGGGGGTSDHRQLSNRDAANQHPISAISGLEDALLGKQDEIADLETIRSGASLGATAVQPEAGKGLFSGSYDDLTDKPTILQPITEYLKSASVSGNTLNLTKQDDSVVSFTPQGGGGEKTWQLIKSAVVPSDPSSDTSGVTWVTNENGIYRFVIDSNNDGNPFSYKKIRLIVKIPNKDAGGCCTGNFRPLLGINIPAPTGNEGWVFLPYNGNQNWASVIVEIRVEDDGFVKTELDGSTNALFSPMPGYYLDYASKHFENRSLPSKFESNPPSAINNVVFNCENVVYKSGTIIELYAEV